MNRTAIGESTFSGMSRSVCNDSLLDDYDTQSVHNCVVCLMSWHWACSDTLTYKMIAQFVAVDSSLVFPPGPLPLNCVDAHVASRQKVCGFSRLDKLLLTPGSISKNGELVT